jgi:hypothetical protein
MQRIGFRTFRGAFNERAAATGCSTRHVGRSTDRSFNLGIHVALSLHLATLRAVLLKFFLYNYLDNQG